MAVSVTPWQFDCYKVDQRCGYLLTSGLWTDCIFMVGSETNQEVIQAHKLVLAMASPVFEAMFYGGLSKPNDPIVLIPDVQPEAFRAVLHYIHTGNINLDSLDMAWDVMYGAKKYILPRLEKECSIYISSVLSARNACGAYELARLLDNKTVMKESLRIMSVYTKEVLNDSSFMDAQLNTVITVLSLDNLNVDSELDLFHAVVRYAEAERRRQGQNSSSERGPPSEKQADGSIESSSQTSPAEDSKPSTEELTSKPKADKDNLKEEELSIHIALQKIRFLTLTARQFSAGPALSGLLTKEESYAVLMNILCDRYSTVVPMPTGFSDSREWREPHRNWIRQCYRNCNLEHIFNALTCGNLSQVEDAAWAARKITQQSYLIQGALDKGLLVALVPALTEGDNGCKHNAVRVITYFCYNASPSQLSVLADSVALRPYCLQLDGGGNTCFRVMSGLTDLLEKIERNMKSYLLGKLIQIGVPKLLKTVQQDQDENYRQRANDLMQKYFSDVQ